MIELMVCLTLSGQVCYDEQLSMRDAILQQDACFYQREDINRFVWSPPASRKRRLDSLLREAPYSQRILELKKLAVKTGFVY